MQIIITLLKPLILPPGIFILMLTWGLWRTRYGKGKLIILFSIIGLYLLSISAVSNYLLMQVESIPPLNISEVNTYKAEAIVVLGGGIKPRALEYARKDTVSVAALTRIRYAAYLSKQTGLPIITTGGNRVKIFAPEAEVAQRALIEEFGVPVLDIDNQSLSTLENARMVKKIMDKHGIKRVFVVTHAYHMPRALSVFQQTGIDAVPAATEYNWIRMDRLGLISFIPNAGSLLESSRAIHEYIGRVWYWLRVKVL